MSMRVLVISATFPPMRSGGAHYAFWLCRHLAESRLDIRVITSSIENVATHPRMQVYPVMRQWSWREIPRLSKIVRHCRPDIVNLHFSGPIYNDHPMVTFTPTILKRLIPDVRVVTLIEYPNGVEVGRLPLPTRAVRKVVAHWVGSQGVDYGYGTILRDSDCIIVLSDTFRDILAKCYAKVEEKCMLIPPPPLMLVSMETNGDSRRRGRDALRVTPDEFLIAYYGYLYPNKGIETLLEGLHLVTQQGANVRLVIVGGNNEVLLKRMNRPRYMQELQELSERLGIAHKVVWTGDCPSDSEQASLYLRGADTCVLPFDDGVKLHRSSVAAAAAHGLPIITTKGEILEFPFIDQKNVFLCPPKDPKSLAVAIDSLISNPELRERLHTGSLQLSHEWFSWDKTVQRTIEAFKSVGRKDGKSRRQGSQLR